MAMQEVESAHPQIPRWTLGERLAKARREAGLSQNEMAAHLRDRLRDVPNFKCKDSDTVSAWETDAREPGLLLPTLRAWALICHVPFEWLATGLGDGETDRLVTYWGTPLVVENAQERLPMELPPAKHSPTLAVVE